MRKRDVWRMLEKCDMMQKVKNYLRNHNIKYVSFNESNRPLLITDVDCIVIPYPANRVIGKRIEVQLRFRDVNGILFADICYHG